MYYYDVEVSDTAKKFIKKLDNSLQKRVSKFINNLKIEPIPRNKKHILESIGSSMLCESVIDKLRFYYTIENKFVVIEDIKYRGYVEILEGHSNHKSGNKKNYPNQRKDISKLKRWFNNLFRK